MAQKIAIIGAGSWATALMKIVISHTEKIIWYVRDQETIDYIKQNRHNPDYLSSVEFDTTKIEFFCDINEAVKEAEILIVAIPSAFLKSAFSNLTTSIKEKIVVSAIKGIIPDDNLIIAEYFNKYFNVPLNSMAIIAGPCHAEEVALERLSYLTVASQDLDKARLISEFLECRFIKTSISDDIYGTEYSAVLKNIFAIAAGICGALGYGDNFQAVLISNAIQEIKRFVDAVYPIDRDIKSSAYLGDLLVTAYSQFSRNRTFGVMVGKGYSVKFAQLEMNMIAEGYYAVKSIYNINQFHNVYLPITNAVYNIIYNKIPPAREIKLLTEILQ